MKIRTAAQRRTLRKTQELSHKRSITAKFGSLCRRIRTRYYISLNLRYSYNPKGKTRKQMWPNAVWPILFHSRELAEKAMECLPIFYDADTKPNMKSKIKSVCIVTVRLPKRR